MPFINIFQQHDLGLTDANKKIFNAYLYLYRFFCMYNYKFENAFWMLTLCYGFDNDWAEIKKNNANPRTIFIAEAGIFFSPTSCFNPKNQKPVTNHNQIIIPMLPHKNVNFDYNSFAKEKLSTT